MPADPRWTMLSQAHQLLSQMMDRPPEVFTVTITADGQPVTLSFKSEPGEFQLGEENLNTRQRTILDAFRGDQALSTGQIAQKTGYRNNSALRAALAELVQMGLLTVTDDGYRAVT